MQFRPTVGTDRRFMHTFTQPTGAWQFNTFNRMRFWVKMPPGSRTVGGGQKNVSFGTYVRCSTCSHDSYEAGGGHFYHHFDIPYTGEWHQVILDTHPTTKRGIPGGSEIGNKEYVTGESNFNYFDALTRFYFDGVGLNASNPAAFYFDGFELYRETRQRT